MPSTLLVLISLAGAIAVLGCEDDQSVPVALPECDVTAASDASTGPVTAQELVNQLEPGETGCLREGTYAADDQVTIDAPDVTLTSFPGERATVVGRIVVEESGEGATIANLDLDGRNPDALPSLTINAGGVVLAGNNIFNENTAICVNVDDYEGSPIPESVIIERNRIHDCGELPSTNRHHGIYLAEARNTLIRDNWIYDNADRGIQLYPDADGTTITGNVIDGNGEGIIFSGDEDDHSDDNIVAGNTITNSRIRYNVEANWPGPVGTGNVLRANCIFGGAKDSGEGGIESPPEGFTPTDNLVADPGYVDPDAGDFRLPAESPCFEVLDGSPAP